MNNNYSYQRPYNLALNEQGMYDQITGQINQLQQMREQIKNNMQHQQQPTNINQTFQIAPTPQGGMKYANSIDDVNKEMVFVDTPFFSKDMSILWVKTPKNEVKAYELNEIVEKDEKDLQIELLMAQIEELKKGNNNEQFNSNVNETKDTTDTTTNDDTTRATIEKSKSTSVSKVSGSKEK